uniref:G-protein coupled receptors family 1 profile domain-containing protein n=1 Tax=Romanomermis culicivorax TaxID=13658 RepID=A0A915I8M5_ROMCU
MSMVIIMTLIAMIIRITCICVQQTPANIFKIALITSIVNFWMPLFFTSFFYTIVANRIRKSIKDMKNAKKSKFRKTVMKNHKEALKKIVSKKFVKKCKIFREFVRKMQNLDKHL